jgi:diguanylate cyclase (GGDEF)-like protein
LDARLFWQVAGDDWRSAQTDDPGLLSLLGPAPAAQAVGFSQDGQALVSAIAVTPFSDDVSALLVLQYPVAQAMAPFHSMMLVILGVSLAGLLVIILGSWLVSRSLARPILALERAAGRLARGERGGLARVSGQDEIARLAESFNAMGEQIAAREQRITHMALHDTDTGVPNLAALENEVDARRARSGRDRVFAVLVGIDRFDKVRGAIGYALSSHMIADLVQRLERLFPDAFVGRVSTDTLGLIIDAESVERVLEQAKAVMTEANKPVQLGEDQVDIHATVGVAALADTQRIGLTVIECAGVAVDQVRARGERLGPFDSHAYGDPTRVLSLMSRMIEGLGSGDLFLAYQPKHDFRAQAVTACEALLRWRDPERGFIGPDEFIPLAEETGHILPLTEWVLDRAIADQVRMKAAGHDLQVAINVSGRLISDPRFVAAALNRLSRHSGRICFEITETAVIENPEQALEHMTELRAAGVSVSIDDYGSGLSSLAYLRSIPAEELKIDKAFVMELDASQADRLLVKSTIDLAHSLGLKVTAEGVENAESIALLAGMGADFAQGYHIGRPMPLADFLGHISALPDAGTVEPLRRVQG